MKLNVYTLTILHSEMPKLYGVLAILSQIELRESNSAIFIFVSLLKVSQFLQERICP